MKNILYLLFLTIFFSCEEATSIIDSKKPKENNPEVNSVENKRENSTSEKTNSLTKTKAFLATKSGRIEEFYIQKNQTVRKNQLLFRYDNKKAFEEISSEKERLNKQILDSLLLHPELGKLASKWKSFQEKITSSKVLPSFPKIEYREEAYVFYTNEIKKQYSKITILEESMLRYFHKSKQKLKIDKMYVKSKSFVNKNDTIFTYTE